MTMPRDDWDAEERETLAGLEAELAEIRRRHQGDPSLAMLRAAAQNALPPALQARVDRHVQDSAWSRAIVDGLREAGGDVRLDADSEARLLKRINSALAAEGQASGRSWTSRFFIGGLALAATALVALVVPRAPVPVPADDSASQTAASSPATSVAAETPAPPFQVAYTKPPIKLSSSALTWRGTTPAKPFVETLAPAFEAYRAGHYSLAVAEFDRLAAVYPGSIDVLFYQGISRMLAGDDAGAIAPLEAAGRIRSTTFDEDVRWYLAVARQRSGDPAGPAAFSSICDGGSAHAGAACAALRQLNAGPAATPRQP
jgi:hypothetical protein